MCLPLVFLFLWQQMRQKSKQQAKMEASQKLEQVKNEQRQQLAAQRLPRPASPDNSSRSPMTPGMVGSASPVHTSSPREGQSRHLLLQAHPGQADVFLKPQAPPLSGFSSPLHQPPSSPQMFSPPSSRPSSPWDPLKGGGSSRPGSLPGSQQQRGTSLSPSPGQDMFGSPAPSPDSKVPADASRNLLSHSGNLSYFLFLPVLNVLPLMDEHLVVLLSVQDSSRAEGAWSAPPLLLVLLRSCCPATLACGLQRASSALRTVVPYDTRHWSCPVGAVTWSRAACSKHLCPPSRRGVLVQVEEEGTHPDRRS